MNLSSVELAEAITAHRAGDLSTAIAGYRARLRVQPDNPDALHYLGVALAQQEKLQEGLECLRKAVLLDSENPEVHRNLAGVLFKNKRFDEALGCIDASLSLDSGNHNALLIRGSVLRELGRVHEAIECSERVISEDPDNVISHINKGNAFLQLDNPGRGLASFDQALALVPLNIEAQLGRAGAYADLGKRIAALSQYDGCLSINPKSHLALTSKAVLDQRSKNFTRAMGSLASAAAIQSESVDVAWNLALINLQLGDWHRGFSGYESRFSRSDYRRVHAERFLFPRLSRGDWVSGKRVLVHSEQGLGDSIQFSRFVPLLTQQNADVTFMTPKPLVSLFRDSPLFRCAIESEVISQGFDYHVPLMSLPWYFGTEPDSAPFAQVGYLSSNSVKRDSWRARLGKRQGPRVGVMWSGGTGSRLRNRSLDLAEFSELIGRGADWVSLQKEVSKSDRRFLPRIVALRHFGEQQQDFSDAAAIIEDCDLVISVDTSIAHLAGAMGKLTWIMLPYDSDWRWLEGSATSVWYPSVRLFRQDREGDWQPVIQRVMTELRQMFGITYG
jgi:tetratricopeptide (TPR) repeat protein